MIPQLDLTAVPRAKRQRRLRWRNSTARNLVHKISSLFLATLLELFQFKIPKVIRKCLIENVYSQNSEEEIPDKQNDDEDANRKGNVTYGIDDVPPWYLCIFMALQVRHVVLKRYYASNCLGGL